MEIYDMIHLLTAIGLTPGGSNTVHIYTQIHSQQHNEEDYQEQNIITIIHKHNNRNI